MSNEYIATFTDISGKIQHVPFTSRQQQIAYVPAHPDTGFISPAFGVKDLDTLRSHLSQGSKVEVLVETGELVVKSSYGARMHYAAVARA